jgi:ribosomal protein S18 acetylase RimI-like enzyme
MSEYGRERIFEIVQKNVTPPGHFQNVLAKRSGWLGLFCYGFEGPRWNQLIPVPGEAGDVPGELLELASDIAENHSIYGESGFVDEVLEELGLEGAETAYEMTYLVPDDLPEKSSLPDVEFRRTDSEEVREDFVEIFRKAFGEKEADGSHSISDEMLKGIRRIIEEKAIGVDRTSFVGYMDGEAVATGTLTAKDGDGFMFNVASHPDHRGKGLGSAVSVKLNEEAKEKGLDEVFIGTQPGTDVENFYRNIGCREVFRTRAVEIENEELR